MSIAFQCTCGKKLKADEANAGHRVRCPSCCELVNVPTKDLGYEVVDTPDEEVEDAEAVDDEGFEVLESERDLPSVERVKKRKKDTGRNTPRRSSIHDDLYSTSPRLSDYDPVYMFRLLWVGSSVLGLCIFVLCLACGIMAKLAK